MTAFKIATRGAVALKYPKAVGGRDKDFLKNVLRDNRKTLHLTEKPTVDAEWARQIRQNDPYDEGACRRYLDEANFADNIGLWKRLKGAVPPGGGVYAVKLDERIAERAVSKVQVHWAGSGTKGPERATSRCLGDESTEYWAKKDAEAGS